MKQHFQSYDKRRVSYKKNFAAPLKGQRYHCTRFYDVQRQTLYQRPNKLKVSFTLKMDEFTTYLALVLSARSVGSFVFASDPTRVNILPEMRNRLNFNVPIWNNLFATT